MKSALDVSKRNPEPTADKQNPEKGFGGLEANGVHRKVPAGVMEGGLTKEANRHRLHRDADQSRDSKMLRESGRRCRRGPS